MGESVHPVLEQRKQIMIAIMLAYEMINTEIDELHMHCSEADDV